MLQHYFKSMPNNRSFILAFFIFINIMFIINTWRGVPRGGTVGEGGELLGGFI